LNKTIWKNTKLKLNLGMCECHNYVYKLASDRANKYTRGHDIKTQKLNDRDQRLTGEISNQSLKS